jgi:hypothetical protein
LPAGARLFGDNAEGSTADEAGMLDETAVRLIPARRDNMQPHADFLVTSNPGFELKVLASTIALA